jgi:predicted Zn finger-like uncharacterized protein
MSLVTACPSCGVLFKVAPDQLLISEGWVRCGKCQTVFDAALSLKRTIRTQKDSFPEDPELAPPLAEEVVSEEVHTEEALAGQAPLAPSPQAPGQSSMLVFDLVPERTDAGIFEDVQFQQAVSMPAEKVSSAWRQSWLRNLLYLLTPILLLALLMQVILFQRNEIASREPLAKPWLVALCAPFDCRLSTLKHIQSIVIDSSTFSKISPDIYQQTLVLKNSSTADVQLPSVELTLINSLDQPLLRRVFRVDELNVQSRSLLAASELPLSFSFEIKPGELSDRVAGYRLLVFYP